jgi:hypothetical protein
MSQFDSQKDYYAILGANERTPQGELERLYKRMAARRHPDRGGSEEEMKSLNEAYSVLKNSEARREYDAQRIKAPARFVRVTTPTASDVGLLGHGLSAFFCLLLGLFLLFLVRFQGMWFLWPLAILAALVVVAGVIMARSTMRALNAALPLTNPFRRFTGVQEAVFWGVVIAGCYGIYLLMTAV